MAYKRDSIQSSTLSPTTLSLANDGDRFASSATCVLIDVPFPTAWWGVKLDRESVVRCVAIITNADFGTVTSNPIFISVGSDHKYMSSPLCVRGGEASRGKLERFDCPPLLRGQYVTVFLKNAGYALNICEVEVFE